jgi:hypothetical protein
LRNKILCIRMIRFPVQVRFIGELGLKDENY